jgi:hypothetical protein
MYQYELEVDDGERTQRIYIFGSAVPEDLRPLSKSLEARSERQRGSRSELGDLSPAERGRDEPLRPGQTASVQAFSDL